MSAILEQQKKALSADPDDVRTFDALEEHFFMSGNWDELAGIYRTRLRAPSFAENPPTAAPLLFRLAQVLEERCIEIDKAVECYWKVAKLDPTFRPALQQLRQIHSSREHWDIVLQIAEMESALPMENFERATFQAEMGDIWLKQIGDPGEARNCYDRALELVPGHQAGLAGLAGTHEAAGRHEEAAAVLEQLVARLRGPDRAPCLVALGQILAGPLEQPERASECYRKALSDDPRNEEAVEALLATTAALEQWPLLADLYERRFDLAAGARRRTGIALEAGILNLERLDNTQAARMWFDRALELSSDNVEVHRAVADLERRTGNRNALVTALDQIILLAENETPVVVLLEAAEIHGSRGDDERALDYLKRAQAGEPQSPQIVEALSSSLSRLGRSSELAEVLEQRAALCSHDPVERARILAELGRLHEEELHDAESAAEALASAFELDPRQPGVATSLERLYRKAEDWESLRGLLDRALREGLPEERCALLTSTGELLAEQLGESEGATRAFEAALEIEPQSARALQGLERLALQSGDEEAILRSYQREAAITTDRTRLTTLVRELVRLLEERDRKEEALQWAEKLNQAVPEDRTGLETVARLRAELGRVEELVESLERLDDLLHGREQAANRRRLAALHQDAGRHEEAIALYESALRSDSEDVDSLRALRAHYEEIHELDGLSRVYRRLADLLAPDEAAGCLDELAKLLEHQLGDVEGAIVVLWRLVDMRTAQRPADAGERLENLLERAGRFEELAQQLLERRRNLGDGDEAAVGLDARRAQLLLDQLGQFEEAARLFRRVREQEPTSLQAVEGLERALRAANDSEGLVELLGERAEASEDAEQAASWRFERAVLLEESLCDFDQAREAFEALTSGAGSAAERSAAERSVAEESAQRLERLLERAGDWEALRELLEARLAGGDPRERCELHETLASLCRDRLGDREGCVRHLEEAGSLAPENPAIWHKLALVYRELDRKDDLLRVIGAELSTPVDVEREIALRSQAARLCTELDPELGGRGEEAAEHYERLLTLTPGSSEASEYLIEHYEREDRPADVVRLLEMRLAAAELADAKSAKADGARGARGAGRAGRAKAQGTASSPGAQASSISLRLRTAALRADRLDDLEGAIDVLEPALHKVGPVPPVAEPLADLYQRGGRRDALIDLCRRSSQACHSSAERAAWQLRLADALREAGDAPAARDAYRAVLAEHPNDLDAEAALRELYRELGEAAPLARLLERQIERVCGDEQIRLRMELAGLYADSLDRPADAFHQLDQVLALDPADSSAFDGALELAEQLGRSAELLKLLDLRLSRGCPPDERAALLERRGNLLASTLDKPEQAVTALREAIAIDPERSSARDALREILESLSRWPAVLDCLYLDARVAAPAKRAGIFERAVTIAMEHLSPDSALPWLERLRAERPGDPSVAARVAEVHRQAGRPEALLRALEQQIELLDDAVQERDVHIDCARVLERDLASPGRALAALEAARDLDPDHPGVLEELDRLYESLGRVRERAMVIDARIRKATESERAGLHRTAALLWTTALADPERAIPHTLRAVALAPENSAERIAMLRELQEQLRASYRMDAWIRAAEAELEARETHGDTDPARINELHIELALCYDAHLANRDAALHHLHAAMQTLESGSYAEELENAPPSQSLDAVEAIFIDHLRADRNHVELEKRLTRRLSRQDGDAESWLELARLRDERLHAPRRAEAAYRELLERDPGSLAAIHGLRGVAERLGDWSCVAETLDLEVARPGSAHRRAALLRRLGDVALQRLDSPERAGAAYAKALECSPDDLHCLRALQRIRERGGEYEDTIDLYEREVELLGAGEAARRQRIWLRAGALARDQVDDPARALEAYEAAAALGELEPDRNREWAELYGATGDNERFAEVWASWCDGPQSGASCADHLALVEILEDLDRPEDALGRAQRAIEEDDSSADAWDRSAKLLEQCDRLAEAAEALSRAAELRGGSEAAEQLMRAAGLVAGPGSACSAHSTERAGSTAREDSEERAAALLRRAAQHDPGSAAVHARLTAVASKLGLWQEAEAAAGRALDLNAGGEELGRSQLLETALAGGGAARKREQLESAARFYSAVLALEPEHIEALEAQGEVLFQRGDVTSARHVMEKRLGLRGDDPKRGHHLAIVAMGYELEENTEAALEHFRGALDADVSLDEAHEGIVRIHENAGNTDEAIRALEEWIEVQSDPRARAAQLLHAARLELAAGLNEGAERHLRKSVAFDPLQVNAWVLLTELLWEQERAAQALESASEGLTHSEEPEAVRTLSLIRARALEGRDEQRKAADAYAEAVRCDPRCVEGALSRSRLLRGLGDWEEAAAVLEDFTGRHPEPSSPELAQVHYKRGRLLAGPLEEVHGAIECYERALEIDPSFSRAREPLANLLVHLPERHRDAIAQHRMLLGDGPSGNAPLRPLLRLARQRDLRDGIDTGLAILSALGWASPDELAEAPAQLSLRLAPPHCFADESWEKLRRAAEQTAQELSRAIAPAVEAAAAQEREKEREREGERERDTAWRAACPGHHVYWDTLRGAEAELSAPGFERLSAESISSAMRCVTALSLDGSTRGLDSELVDSLERSLGRWSRRKVRKLLEGLDCKDVEALDWEGWRNELRVVAASLALDRCEGDLRTALIALVSADLEERPSELGETADISNLVASSATARALLLRVALAWCDQLERAL